MVSRLGRFSTLRSRARGGASTRLLALCACALGACAQEDRPLTQLILVADTDLANIDTIQFEVHEEAGSDQELAQAVHSASSGPAFVSLVRDEGSLGPLSVTARGVRAGAVQIERTQRVSFVPKQTRVVLLHLFASCLRPSRCSAEQACDDSGCIPKDLPPAQLPPWTGAPPPLNGGMVPATDAGAGDAGAGDAQVADAGGPILRQCGPASTLVDIQSNVAHCGGCDKPCSMGMGMGMAMHFSSVSCVTGACAYVCEAGWSACDGMTNNGCETDTLTSNEHCGKCGSKCSGGGKMCMAGACIKP